MSLCGAFSTTSVESAPVEPGDVAGELDDGPLEAVADPEIRDPAGPREFRRRHHAAAAAIAEPRGHQDAGRVLEEVQAARLLERFGFDVLELDLQAMPDPAVEERLVDALVRILVLDVLPDEVERDLVGRVPDALDEVAPVVHAGLGDGQAQPLQQDLVQALFGEIERHLVDARDVARGDDRLFVDVTEERDLPLHVVVERPIGPAEQHIGLDTDRPQVAHAVLRGFGLEFAGRRDERHQRQVDIDGVVAADVLAKLPDRLEKRQTLDVADRAADFDEQDVDVLGGGADALLDLVRDVRDDLHRPPEVVAASLLLNDRQIDLAGRPVVVPRGTMLVNRS